MIDCEFDTLILSLVLIWIFYVFSFNLQLSVLIPSKEVLILFLEVMNPIFDKIDILKQQLMGLTEARDRLLPKLMSGEIEV